MTSLKNDMPARDPKRFFVTVEAIYLAYLKATGVSPRDYFLEPSACARMYREGAEAVTSLFGDVVANAAPMTPYIAYGHLSALGGELTFPEDGEVSVAPFYSSLDEGLDALKRPIDFSRAGMAPFYLAFHRELKAAFPERSVGFGYANAGPITTAFLARGQDFMLDLYDAPEKAKTFLATLVDSALAFHRWKCRHLGVSPVNPSGGAIADDIAAMIAPEMWEEIVLPAWERWFQGVTVGKRRAHCEGLSPEHLPFLERAGLASFDPFVSPKLDPEILATAYRGPFQWGLPSFKYRAMTAVDAADMVYLVAAAGAELAFTHVEGNMMDAETAAKVFAFARAGDDAKKRLASGASRASLAEMVSPSNRTGYWEKWKNF